MAVFVTIEMSMPGLPASVFWVPCTATTGRVVDLRVGERAALERRPLRGRDERPRRV